jgi:hypothetical protein
LGATVCRSSAGRYARVARVTKSVGDRPIRRRTCCAIRLRMADWGMSDRLLPESGIGLEVGPPSSAKADGMRPSPRSLVLGVLGALLAASCSASPRQEVDVRAGATATTVGSAALAPVTTSTRSTGATVERTSSIPSTATTAHNRLAAPASRPAPPTTTSTGRPTAPTTPTTSKTAPVTAPPMQTTLTATRRSARLLYGRKSASPVGSGYDLVIRDMATSAVHIIANDLAADPTWSPDGSTVVYVSEQQVWSYTIATGDKRLLTSGWRAAFAPDGTALAVVEGAGSTVVVMAADGTHPVTVAAASAAPPARRGHPTAGASHSPRGTRRTESGSTSSTGTDRVCGGWPTPPSPGEFQRGHRTGR